MIIIRSGPRPSEYSIIVIQVFSAAQSGWCDYRDLQDSEDSDEIIATLETVYSGNRFRLVTRYIKDVRIGGSRD